MKLRLVLSIALASTVLILGACSDDSDDSVSEDASELCSDLSSLQSTVTAVFDADIDPATVSKEDLENGIDTIQSEVDEVLSAESDLSENVKSQLQSAVDDFRSALGDIDDDTPLAEAGEAVVTAGSELRAAWDAVLAELTCSPTTTGG